ncbi:hypothetical protein B0J15DRAFT_533957 [Fusarium solani]|uniref:Uncharacterized protein n=1 Tax=Fusarium solani TaxID=169388 RepID=A0A9P9KUJ6_FUSSL|nr:uncharacterized protein B0J15DRAFT_533957 [Fusarium solani]KAH7268751.1 hypothetical protein B0J15DRAFT_533957 [Fusarium solani]
MVVLQDPPYDRIFMSGPHKRRRLSSQSPPPPTDIAHHSSKKKKLNHPAFPPPRFWDNLSEKHLTRNALRELDRRNAKVAQDSKRRRNHSALRATAKIERPQPIDRLLGQCSPTCLGRIKRSARQGGPDLGDLRGYRTSSPQSEMSSNQSSLGRRKRGSQSPSKSNATSNTTTTKSTGPYDRAFQQHLIDHDVYPDRYEYPDGRIPPRPGNLEEIRQALGQPRASLSPSQFSDDKFEAFQRADAHASKESQVIADVIPMIEGNVGDRKCVARQVPFTNLDHLTDGTLVPGNPDLYYGARPEQLDQKVRQELRGRIIPSTQHDLPIVPNFFLEVKGPDGSAAVAKRQLLYDMALGATGYDAIRSYKADAATFDNKAYTIGCTYQDGQLKMYASHPIEPSICTRKPGIVMTQLKAFALTNDPDTFRQGAAAYRNGRDWAKQQRDQVIAQANERTGLESPGSPQSDALGVSFRSDASCVTIEATGQKTITNAGSHAVPSLYDSDTSADELSLDFQPPTKRSRSPRKQSYTTIKGETSSSTPRVVMVLGSR